jgi:hypothetical protein
MTIEILYFSGCPNRGLAERRVREALRELGVDARVIHVNVEDEKTAERVRFPGSPTVRVNGADVAPIAGDAPIAMSCRVYSTPSGFGGAPDKAAIRAAIAGSTA